jgi:murein DD-endopeptidase MepM/ murein hydrolase activator NlpD
VAGPAPAATPPALVITAVSPTPLPPDTATPGPITVTGSDPGQPALPTTGASLTPAATPLSGTQAAGTSTPITPCGDPDCATLHAHLWLERPIPDEPGLVNYVDRSYPYGSTQDGLREPHHGVEFANPAGVPVVAAAPGEVVVAGSDNDTGYGPAMLFYGRLVVVRLEQEYLGQPVFNLYGHLSSVSVAEGDRVAAGDLLGLVGQTGVAIGPHLHFEVRVGHNDYASTRNPELWLKPLAFNGQPLGLIAGRVEDAAGNLLPSVTVVIRPIATDTDRPRSRYVQTYAGDATGINADEHLQENFAINDIPRGLYSVSVNTTRFYQQNVTVEAGQVAWVTFVVEPPPPTALPTTPGPETPTPSVPSGTPGTPGVETPAAEGSAAPTETPAATEGAPADPPPTGTPPGDATPAATP